MLFHARLIRSGGVASLFVCTFSVGRKELRRIGMQGQNTDSYRYKGQPDRSAEISEFVLGKLGKFAAGYAKKAGTYFFHFTVIDL